MDAENNQTRIEKSLKQSFDIYKMRMNISSDIYCVDIEALAKMLGYEIYNVTLGDDAELMGFTAFEPALLNFEHQNGYAVPVSVTANTIVLNDSIKDTCIGRYRFTAAHEVAHLILDMVYHLGYRVRYRSNPKMINNIINYIMVYENETNVKVVAEVHCPVCNWRIMDVEKGTKGGILVKCPNCKKISRISLAYRLKKHSNYRFAS